MNKSFAIVGRGESRDVVDAYFLTMQGLDPEDALVRANQKDGGVDAGTLLYVLSDIDWERFQEPGVEPEFVKASATFFREWTERIARSAYPGEPY